MKLKKPKMIIFDYGHTLLYEPGFDPVGGMSAVLKRAIRNSSGKSIEELAEYIIELYEDMGKRARSSGMEFHCHMLLRAVFEQHGIEFDLPYDEIESIFWEGFTPGITMPGIAEFLDYINEHGIRSAVISNISFSEKALTRRICSRLPQNNFEFFIASSEYALRKPNKILFDIALKKAKLPAESVWFCGDSLNADVHGAASAGILPVWYENPIEGNFRREQSADTPVFPHIHINEWSELRDILENL